MRRVQMSPRLYVFFCNIIGRTACHLNGINRSTHMVTLKIIPFKNSKQKLKSTSHYCKYIK